MDRLTELEHVHTYLSRHLDECADLKTHMQSCDTEAHIQFWSMSKRVMSFVLAAHPKEVGLQIIQALYDYYLSCKIETEQQIAEIKRRDNVKQTKP
jgi:hypothetical protein